MRQGGNYGGAVAEVRYLPYGEACPECMLSLTKGLSKGTLDQWRHPDQLHLHRPAQRGRLWLDGKNFGQDLQD
jgi:hypothetical protein